MVFTWKTGTIHVDHVVAISLATAEGGSWKTRHLKGRHRALRGVEQRWEEVVCCPGDQQLADGLIKVLPSKKINNLMVFGGALWEVEKEMDF